MLDEQALKAAMSAQWQAERSDKNQHDAMEAAILAYLSRVPAPEPVAWLCNGESKGYWREVNRFTTDREYVAQREGNPYWTIQPLYASPVDVEAMRRELEEVKRERDELKAHIDRITSPEYLTEKLQQIGITDELAEQALANQAAATKAKLEEAVRLLRDLTDFVPQSDEQSTKVHETLDFLDALNTDKIDG